MSQGGGDGGGKPEKEVPVHLKNLKTNQKVDFKMPEMATVAATWARAYTELGEQRAADDEFQCADGTSLMGKLTTTLEQLHAENVCQARKFEIRGPTGGAIMEFGFINGDAVGS
jgi:hypothetical protein